MSCYRVAPFPPFFFSIWATWLLIHQGRPGPIWKCWYYRQLTKQRQLLFSFSIQPHFVRRAIKRVPQGVCQAAGGRAGLEETNAVWWSWPCCSSPPRSPAASCLRRRHWGASVISRRRGKYCQRWRGQVVCGWAISYDVRWEKCTCTAAEGWETSWSGVV